MAINWQAITTLAELATNVSLTALGAAGVVPASSAALASGIEAAVNPLMNALAAKEPVQTDIQAGYGALISALNILAAQPGLDVALLTKIGQYARAAQDAMNAYLIAESGYKLSLFTVDAPMVDTGTGPVIDGTVTKAS